MIRPALSLSLRDLLHIRGYKLCFAERVEKTLYVTLSTKRKTGVCPVCGKRCRNIEMTFGRWIRDRDVSDYKCYILFPERKIKCRCGYRGIEKLEFVIGFSRTKETLDSLFKELGPLKSHAIKVAVMDMWGPYIASVKAHTNADIVFDKFPYQRKSTRQLTLFANKSLRKQTLKRERR